ncbi:MAG: inositol monophosphatase family protein [Bryobacteraceae bacterium]
MYQYELLACYSIARQAGETALRYWRQGLQPETKPDDSPVTVADRESERLIVRLLEEKFPEDGVLGEEGASKPSRNGRRWIIDPIDGTRDFVRGNTAWAVLLALEVDGQVVAGTAFLPAMGDMFGAAKGQGAFRNHAPIRASATSELSQAVVCVNGLNDLRQFAFAGGLLGWLEGAWAVRSMGGCLDAVMVASGQADLWIETSGKAWDFAPLKILAEEAGARFFNFDGGASIHGGNCVICSPGLEPEARRLVGASGN